MNSFLQRHPGVLRADVDCVELYVLLSLIDGVCIQHVGDPKSTT